jgi:hypothetical protein
MVAESVADPLRSNTHGADAAEAAVKGRVPHSSSRQRLRSMRQAGLNR